MGASTSRLTSPRRTEQHGFTALETSNAVVPTGNKGFFMPGLQAKYKPTYVGSERNTTGIRPEHSRSHWTVSSSRRPSFEGRQPLEKVQTMSKHSTGVSVANTSVRYVHRDTVIRRIRRHHAKFGNTFHIARNRAEFDSLGDWHIRDRNGDVAFRNIAIFESYARDAGCLAADELMFGQTLYRMFDDQGRIIGVQESKYRAESVVKAISGTLVEFVVEVPVEQADQSGDAHA
jgi:hypothetical protein